MRDIDRFIELYKSIGVDLKINVDEKGNRYIMIGEENTFDSEVTTSKLFTGYLGFYSIIMFDDDGKFISQGFYE